MATLSSGPTGDIHANPATALNVFIALGSNLGDGPRQIYRALDLIDAHPDLDVARLSPLYRTAPWGVNGQPDFTNAVAELSVRLEPLALLQQLKQIERSLGRSGSGPRWGPRLIDLDILLHGERILFLPGLTVPHPRMQQRAFVLVPLSDLAPELEIPGRGKLSKFLGRVSHQDVRPIPGAGDWCKDTNYSAEPQ